MLAALNTLLFPFTRLVWRSLTDTLFRSKRTWFLADPLLFITLLLKLLELLFLWAFTILIAPLGTGYLLLRTRTPAPPQEDH